MDCISCRLPKCVVNHIPYASYNDRRFICRMQLLRNLLNAALS